MQLSAFGVKFDVKWQDMTLSSKKIFENGNLNSSLDLVQLGRNGVPIKVLTKIQKFTTLSSKELSQILPVSERQLLRYSAEHILKKDISSHLIQLVELFDKGYSIFGKEKFQNWIRSKILVLEDKCPLDFMDTPIGINLLEDILGRIKYGVYS